jgi:hypothetical protein
LQDIWVRSEEIEQDEGFVGEWLLTWLGSGFAVEDGVL